MVHLHQKDDPLRRRIESYPHRFESQLLFSDMDSLRHLNNGATGRFLEEGRARLNAEVFGEENIVRPDDRLLLLASVTIDYIHQAHYPGRIRIGTAIGRVGNSSYAMVQGAFQDGQCFALAQATLVNAIHGVSTLLTDDERSRLDQRLLNVSG